MKKIVLWILIFTALTMLSACGGAADTLNANASGAPSALSETDIAGRWHVSEVLAPDGTPATDDELSTMGAGFTLELLPGGVYFVYNEAGGALGQGQYAVSSGKLTCTVGEMEIIFSIENTDTLRGKAEDGSITVLARNPEEAVSEPTDTDVVDENSPDDTSAPDGTDITNQDSPDTESDADAPDDSGVVEDEQDSPVTEAE